MVLSDTARVSVLPMVESDTVRVSGLPVAGCEFPAVFLGRSGRFFVVDLGVGPPCLQLDSEETLPALIDERAEMRCTVPGVTRDGGPVEGAPVLEPIEHSVMGKPLDGCLQERTPVLEPLEHSGLEKSSHEKPMEEVPVLGQLEHLVLKKPLDGGSLEGRSVVDWLVRLIMEPLEHSVLATTAVWEPLKYSNCVVTDHVDIDSFWMAPWDAGGAFGDCCRSYVASWRTVFRLVVQLSCRPAFVDFRRASCPPCESGAEECDYIRPARLAGWSVCARTVTGSLLFGSPHRFVRSCLYSVVLSLQWIDDLDISRESTSILQNLHLGTIDGRITPDICISGWSARVDIYLLLLREIVLIFCSFYRAFVARAVASGRSPDMDQAGPSYAPSAPFAGDIIRPFIRHYIREVVRFSTRHSRCYGSTGSQA